MVLCMFYGDISDARFSTGFGLWVFRIDLIKYAS